MDIRDVDKTIYVLPHWLYLAHIPLCWMEVFAKRLSFVACYLFSPAGHHPSGCHNAEVSLPCSPQYSWNLPSWSFISVCLSLNFFLYFRSVSRPAPQTVPYSFPNLKYSTLNYLWYIHLFITSQLHLFKFIHYLISVSMDRARLIRFSTSNCPSPKAQMGSGTDHWCVWGLSSHSSSLRCVNSL